MSANGAKQSHDEQATLSPSEQALKDQQKARARHLLRFREQLVFWTFMTFLTAASYPYHLLSLQEPSWYPWLAAIPIVVFAVVWLYHITRHREIQDHDWEKNVEKAQSLNAQSAASGYTQIFGIYIENKRRSAQLITCAAFLAVYAVTGTFVFFRQESLFPPAYFPIVLAEFAAAVVVAVLLLYRAYALGSSYLAGNVLIRHTLALAVLATSNVSDLQEARRHIEEDTQEFMRASPWWFYPG